LHDRRAAPGAGFDELVEAGQQNNPDIFRKARPSMGRPGAAEKKIARLTSVAARKTEKIKDAMSKVRGVADLAVFTSLR